MSAKPKMRVDSIAYNTLLHSIKSGVWKSGEKLPSEQELCAMLKVSRVSLRSALQRLNALGYIETKPAKKGSYVSDLNIFDFSHFDETITLPENEFNDMAAFREIVETGAIRLIVSEAREIALTRLGEALAAMKKAANMLDLEDYTQHDVQFHLSLISAAGNVKLSQLAAIFKDDFYLCIREMNKFIIRDKSDADVVHSRFAAAYRTHLALYEALENKDPNALAIRERLFARGGEIRNFYFRKRRGK